MITELRWVFTQNGYVLEACDSHNWFPIPIGIGPFQGWVPILLQQGVTTPQDYEKGVYGKAALAEQAAPVKEGG